MKNLSKIAVERPVTFLMIALIVIGFGIFGLSNLRLNLYPDVSFPTVTVYTVYEGVAPEDMETLISRPIEEQVGSISGVVRVRSLSSQGASVVKLYFNWGTDLYQAEADVRKKLDFVRRAIPQDAEQPIVFSYDPNEEPIIVLTLTSKTVNLRELRTIATQQLEQRIERITGIASAETAGGFERQVSIRLKNEKMVAYNVDIASIANRLRSENIQVPAGELVEGNMIYSLRTIGEFKQIEQIKNILINSADGKPIMLSDIADVEDGISQPIGGVHVQGNDGVIINVYKQSDSNVVTAAGEVVNKMDALRKTLPRDVHLEILTNKADFIELSISNLISTGFQAIVLVVLILLFFLRSVKSSFIIAISIPVSIISTFSIMDYADLSLNVISLSGLTLAVGMVVDNAVVVLENIFRFKEDGYNGKTSAINGAQEVAVPVMVSTLTTLVVFLPILFVPGIAGFLFRDLALTISFALIVSTLVALTLIPLMSSKFLNDDSVKKKSKLFLKKISAPINNITQEKVAGPIGRLLDKMESTYSSQLAWALNNKGKVILGSAILFIGTMPLFNQLGGEFFPPVDENAFVLDVAREPGVSLRELERTISQVESIIQQEVPEARLIVSDYGDKVGVEGADNPGGFHGTVRVELTPNRERVRNQFDITASLLTALEVVPGAEIKEVRQNPLSPDGENGLVIQLFGYDPEIKKELSGGIVEKLNELKGIANVISTSDQGRPELRIQMDRERISRVGLNTSQVANAIANAVKGNLATTYIDKGLEYDVVVELDPAEKTKAIALNDIQIRTGTGDWMPLSNLARIERYNGPTNILRINQERVTEIKADLAGVDLKTASEEARSILDGLDWPDGYRYELGGSAEDQAESFRFLLIAFLIAGILTYMVMASQFESLVEPFIIIFTIPLAFTGVILVLYATQTPISVTSMVGLILLSGIVVNNGIVMIDYIKILQARGISRFEAIVTGSSRRLRPILMTAFTTVLSMIPLAMELGSGSETWSPMARTVIGGLTFSTLLMLFVVPCIYYVVNKAVEKLGFDAVHKEDPLAAQEAS
ncbi:efflux RND transporter permease subunit [bacterium]|nr:MAG: efflux RND transporter permease subunit [bacterium]